MCVCVCVCICVYVCVSVCVCVCVCGCDRINGPDSLECRAVAHARVLVECPEHILVPVKHIVSIVIVQTMWALRACVSLPPELVRRAEDNSHSAFSGEVVHGLAHQHLCMYG